MSVPENIDVREEINTARADIWRAVRLDPGPSSRRAMEGDVEAAFMRLDDAVVAIEAGDDSHACRAIAEARELLGSRESALIVEDAAALQAAIDRLESLLL